MQDTCTHDDCHTSTCMTTLERRQQLSDQGWECALYRSHCDNCGRPIGQGSLFCPIPVIGVASYDVFELGFLIFGECCQAEVTRTGVLEILA